MSETITITNEGVLEVVISQPTETIIISEVGLPGPAGATGPAGPSVTANDIEITNTTKGLILKSPNGSRFRLTASNDGTLDVTLL